MNWKIKIPNINSKITPGTTIYIDIDIFKFIWDKDFSDVEVQMESNGDYSYLQTIKLGELNETVVDHKELEKIALNWIFNNVEIVKNYIPFSDLN